MKFMAIFIFIAGLHVSAKANTQITLSEHNVQLQMFYFSYIHMSWHQFYFIKRNIYCKKSKNI